MFRYLSGVLAYLLMLGAALAAALWGTLEFLHEGWFYPYTQIVFYAMPAVVLMLLTVVSVRNPLAGGLILVAAALLFTGWRLWTLAERHIPAQGPVWLTSSLVAVPGLLFLLDAFLSNRATVGVKARPPWKEILVVALPLSCTLALGVPQAIHHLQRVPLKSFREVVMEGSGRRLTLAGEGPAWFYSNKHPLLFRGKTYSGLSWNEIALYGKAPVGLAGKRYGLSYNGTAESITHATQKDFEKYNLFRYINNEGTELTATVQDHWRLPTVEEYVLISAFRGRNAGGKFDPLAGSASYQQRPDKEGPLWAPDKEVIYYWTSTSADEGRAYDITYSGLVRAIPKNTSQDYRGYRAVRTTSR